MYGLHTDLYQLTMAAGYFHRGLDRTVATCELFVRSLPSARRYLLAAGIERALRYVTELRFDDEQLSFLRTVPALRDGMDEAFSSHLRGLRFSGDVWAVPEGTVVFESEPLLRVRAPLIEAQLLETFLLSTVNHATMVASKAARMVRAAAGAELIEFGSRRTHPEAAVDAAQAAYVAGFVGTSNVEAGRRSGVPVLGTAAHMWTMVHDTEEQAFEGYVRVFPNASILLIDTYDTVRGARRAARIARERLRGVRLDSGDLLELSRAVRGVLDAEGCPRARIVASGDLNEYTIRDLVAAGAPIDLYGVGTELVSSPDAPSLGGVYKVVQFERDGRVVPIAKFSRGKVTYPGAHQIYRQHGAAGAPTRDLLALCDEPAPAGATPLLEQRIRGGEPTGQGQTLSEARERARAGLADLGRSLHDLEPAEERYPVDPSPALEQLLAEVRRRQLG
ncbi:MAG: nicotinate phosphoribosyltransferase [Deltaproteobacteria bacterium]|jgi:nicotinate phosphoribosyltransferase|nr:nicotinate phosphoribosyltransferase [Deltaproteobacteria bacterium]MBW2537400.1 nicotinate phosphoribosyltransferase [Deltaproteobacteria bacterium]